MATLARRFGREPREVRLDEPSSMSLEDLALENVVEGCVRETYAVARAMWQAERAEDPRIRAALIARTALAEAA